MPACHAGGRGFEPLPGRHIPAGWVFAGVAQLAEQLICNQQVAGSSPFTSSTMDGYPSGQREQTVNLPSQTSVVRIHLHPPENRQLYAGGFRFSGTKMCLTKIGTPDMITHALLRRRGSIAQLGEHLPYKQRVTGSSPVVPTTKWPGSSVG